MIIEDKLGLAALVGKQIVLQFKQPYTYAVASVRGSKVTPLIVKTRDGQETLLPMPFVVGVVKQRASGHFYMEVLDESDPKRRAWMEVAITPEMQGVATSMSDRPYIEEAPSGLVMP